MDNSKTGALIRARRKELNLTQKELAERLHITDRAVSKWERGLCAPDIALLEPLAETLDVSVVELLEGERQKHGAGVEEQARTVLRYSGEEIARKVKYTRKTYRRILLALLVILAVGGWKLCRSGLPFVVDRIPSPDGRAEAVVYSKELASGGFSLRDATSLIVTQEEHDGSTRITYGNASYAGLWWAPDSRKYVIALDYGEKDYLALAWLDRHVESNLNAYLSMGVETTELRKYGYINETGWPEIEYRFLQWGLDSASMLIYYQFEDGAGTLHEGYFWYNCETGTVHAILEMEP
jgi:transcriptional regulator with XRE-family HTH domain